MFVFGGRQWIPKQESIFILNACVKFWVQIRYRSLCSASSNGGCYNEKNWGKNFSLSFLLGNCVNLSKLSTMMLSLSCTFYTNFGDSDLSSLSQWPQRSTVCASSKLFFLFLNANWQENFLLLFRIVCLGEFASLQCHHEVLA